MSGRVGEERAPAESRPVIPRPRVSIRPARLTDVPALVRFYRGLSPEAQRHYHPLPRNRLKLYVVFSGIAISHSCLGWLMRQRPSTIVGLDVATIEGARDIVGCCTIRGVVRPGREPAARIGVAVADGYRGLGIARRLETAMGELTLRYGVHYQVATVFRSSEPGVRLLVSLGHVLTPTEERDPIVPDEPQFATELNLLEGRPGRHDPVEANVVGALPAKS